MPDASRPLVFQPFPQTQIAHRTEEPRVTPGLGSCRGPCPQAGPGLQPCSYAKGRAPSTAEVTDSLRELRGHAGLLGLAHSPDSEEVREEGGVGSAEVTATPGRKSPCWASVAAGRKGEVSRHQLPSARRLLSTTPTVQSLPGTKAVGAFIIGNYPGLSELARPPIRPLSPAKWTLWQLGRRGRGELCSREGKVTSGPGAGGWAGRPWESPVLLRSVFLSPVFPFFQPRWLGL